MSERARFVGIAMVAALALTTGCRAASSDAGSTDSDRTGAASVLDAVAYSHPSIALDDPSDSTMAKYGDLLFNRQDLNAGYVLEDSWCDQISSRCVTVSGGKGVDFGDQSLKSFVVDTDHSVDDPGLEVVDVRALHHPVSDQLRLVLDVKPTDRAMMTDLQRVQVSANTIEFDAWLDGPSTAAVGVVTRFELRTLDQPVSGRTKLVVPFRDGQSSGDTIQVTIELDDSPPKIDRAEAPLGERPPVAVYRVSEPLSVRGDYGGQAALAELIAAIIDGGETVDLLKPESPGASAVAALAGARDLVRFRHDPDDAASLCWQSYVRGTLCERWHAAELDGGVLTSWSVEGTPIEDLVATRAGSLFGTSMWLFRSPTSDVVLAATRVTNDADTDLDLELYRVYVQRGDTVRSALDATGGGKVLAHTTARSAVLIDAADFDFDVIYSLGSGSDATPVRFAVDAAPAPPILAATAMDPKTASARLASLLRKRRFEDAVATTAPGSPAEAYLQAIVATTSATSSVISAEAERAGSTRVCASEPALACTTIEVTEVDDEGRIRDFTIEGTGVATLAVANRSAQSGDYDATIEQAVSWPKWGLFVAWSVTNSAEAQIDVDSVALMSPTGEITESKRPLNGKVPPGRTLGGEAFFAGASFDAAIEIRGSGQDAVPELSLVVALSD